MHTTSHPGNELLNGWLDDAITDDERDTIDNHLNQCDMCRAELDSLLLVKRLLSELPEPTLPRSFQLTAAQAAKPTSLREASPATVIKVLPFVKALSIAAVMAVIILGGSLAFGPVGETQDSTEQTSFRSAVTNQISGASEDANPAPMANAPGEVVDQGQAATSSNSALGAMTNGIQPPDADDTDGRSKLEIATMVTGAFAVLMVGTWVFLHSLGRSHPEQ